jgi:hypothetical protein
MIHELIVKLTKLGYFRHCQRLLNFRDVFFIFEWVLNHAQEFPICIVATEIEPYLRWRQITYDFESSQRKLPKYSLKPISQLKFHVNTNSRKHAWHFPILCSRNEIFNRSISIFHKNSCRFGPKSLVHHSHFGLVATLY